MVMNNFLKCTTVKPQASMKRGLTIIELLLSVAILTILFVVSIPFFFSMINKNNLDSTRLQAAQGIRRAMLKAQSADQNSNWGIYFTTDKIVIFKGSSYAGRDAGYDIITSVDHSLVFSGDTEIVFTKLTGELSSTKTVTIRSSSSGESKSVTVNTKGAITY